MKTKALRIWRIMLCLHGWDGIEIEHFRDMKDKPCRCWIIRIGFISVSYTEASCPWATWNQK